MTETVFCVTLFASAVKDRFPSLTALLRALNLRLPTAGGRRLFYLWQKDYR